MVEKDLEINEEKLLAAFYKLGLDKKLKEKPERIELEFESVLTEEENYYEWYIEDDVLHVTLHDVNRETGIKSFAAYFAVMSIGIQREFLALLVHFLLVLAPVLLYHFDVYIPFIIMYCWVMVFTYPITWFWAYRSSGFYAAKMKFQFTETGLITGEEEIERFYQRESISSWTKKTWAAMLSGVEFFLLFLIVTLPVLM